MQKKDTKLLTGTAASASASGNIMNLRFENGNPGRYRKISVLESEVQYSREIVEIANKLQNYCGLPDHAFNPSPYALVYQCRKPITPLENISSRNSINSDSFSNQKGGSLSGSLMKGGESLTMDGLGGAGSLHDSSVSIEGGSRATIGASVDDKSFIAQRKVAHALLTMSKNDIMVPHFINRGGYDAITKLVNEAVDKAVLTTCATCLVHASARKEYGKILFDKQILTNVSILFEKANYTIVSLCSQILVNMSLVSNLEESLVLGGAFATLQALIGSTDQVETIAYSIMSICNIATALVGSDAEQVVRIVMTTSKRLDCMHKPNNALFLAEIVLNLTRIPHYGSMLCDDAVMPLLLSLMDAHKEKQMMNRCTECFVNLSINRKNRREIANSGVSNHLSRIFSTGSPSDKANALLMVGNLLSSGFFHDKIAKQSLLSNILDNMLDFAQPMQFVAVSYCISQLAVVETSSRVLVKCGIIGIVLKILRPAPVEASPYLWNLLVNISYQPYFFDMLVVECKQLLPILQTEVEDGKRLDDIATIIYNLTANKAFTNSISVDLQEICADMLRTLFVSSSHTSSNANNHVQRLALASLVNFATYSKPSRSIILGKDLIDVLLEIGLDDVDRSLKFTALLNAISNEESCCIRMLDGGAHKIMVALFGIFTNLPDSVSHEKSVAIGGLQQSPYSPKVNIGEMGRQLLAATYHNLALKRSLLSPGVLVSLMSLLRNSKSLRVLHCTRCLANISTHPRAKLQLPKERKIIPVLTSIMRNGSEEAERVQHYASFVICNTLALTIEKSIMDELVRTGAVMDLIVVTRLRINSLTTKETLAKGLFNLLTRNDYRIEMVLKQDILAALMELSKLESLELLELAIRTIYNLTCQTNVFADGLLLLGIPTFLIDRLNNAPTALGAKSTSETKLLCGMALANMSFDDRLANAMLQEMVADALAVVFQLESPEATYCVCVTLYNLVTHTCTSLSGTVAIPLLVKVLQSNPSATCLNLAVNAIGNLSLLPLFHGQLTECVIPSLVSLLNVPAMSMSIKLEVLKIAFNLSTQYAPSRAPMVFSECTSALWKLLKSQDKDSVVVTIGRICKELCSEATTSGIHKKLLADGIMDILLKLSKKEIPELKYDLSYCIHHLTTAGDTTRVLTWDAVDICFWLTLWDCLNLYNPVRKNVVRALRNFSSDPEEALLLVKEEKFMSCLKSVSSCYDEDVLWQIAGVIYNLMSVDACKALLLQRGIVNIIFEIASSGYESVRHVCSSCLHMIPDEMPDMDDPAVLELVLCLLEADGDKFAELGERSLIVLPYILSTLPQHPFFEHFTTDFVATWLTITCDVDTVFSSVLLEQPFGELMSADVLPYTANSGVDIEIKKYSDKDFYDGIFEANNPARVDSLYNSHTHDDANDINASLLSSMATPSLSAHAPPTVTNHAPLDRNNTIAGSHLPGGGAFGGGTNNSDPILPETIHFPNIAPKKAVLPTDTISAIKSNNRKAHKVEIASTMQVNTHQNKYK